MDAPAVLVVEDDQRIAAYLDRCLAGAGYRVSIAGDGLTALAAADSAKPQVVILDVSLPHMDGLEVARRLRVTSSVPILMLSGRTQLEDRIRGLEAGADDYLGKPFAMPELLARLSALRRGRELAQVVQAPRQAYADVRLDTATRQAWRGERELALRHKTFALLEFFLRHPERVLTRRELLERVWGYDFLGDGNVVDVTVGHLRQALEAAGEPRLINTVRPLGYILRQ